MIEFRDNFREIITCLRIQNPNKQRLSHTFYGILVLISAKHPFYGTLPDLPINAASTIESSTYHSQPVSRFATMRTGWAA